MSYQPYLQSDEAGASITLWRVEIDGELFSEAMQPVSASDTEVERTACKVCGIAGDGADFYIVRRLRHRILWISQDVLNSEPTVGFENLFKTFVFDKDEYEKVLGVGHTSGLPQLTQAEMRFLILRYLPTPSSAVYCNPQIDDDPRGSALLARIQQEFSRDDLEIVLVDEPERTVEINVGLDFPGVPECCCLVGLNEGVLSVMFVANPMLPCWLGGEQTAAIFDRKSIEESLEAMPKVIEKEIWQFLHAIESGSVTLVHEGVPRDFYSGNVTYRASNGWKIVIFSDSSEWDYVDEIVTADGRRIDNAVMTNWYPELDEYSPSDEICWARYFFPGPGELRCPTCDKQFRYANFLAAHKLKCLGGAQ